MTDKNVVFTTPIAGYDIKLPQTVLKEVYGQGAYITTSKGKYAEIHAYVNGKAKYLAPLHSAIKEGRVSFKDGNYFNNTKSNLKLVAA